jgi:DNA-directed RNA polymerase subunit beta
MLGQEDDIDHLGNRRLRTVGELIQQRFRIGLLRTERIIKDRMSTNDPTTVTASQLVNVRPIVASVREFFATSNYLNSWIRQIRWLSLQTREDFLL